MIDYTVSTVSSGRHQKIRRKQYTTSSVGNITLSPYDVFTSRKSRTEMRSGLSEFQLCSIVRSKLYTC